MLISPKKVLWPTDFSELSLHGGRYARGFRDLFGAELHILHVIPTPLTPDVAVMLPTEVPVSISEHGLVEAAKVALRKLVDQQFGGDERIQRHALCGNPWSVVCGYARKHAIDLIVVATHGRTGLGHALIGSTAERIVQHAPCPVLTVKQPERDFLID
jgi:nucleotide-binding universal stress UspA family protein